MKIRYFLPILLAIYALSTEAALGLMEANQYLFRSQVKLEEFSSFSKKGLGTLAQRSLRESKGYIEKLKEIKSQLNPSQAELLTKLDLEAKQKSSLELETIGTCDYRNIEHFNEIDKLKELKSQGSILTFNAYKDLYLLKAHEVKGCKQYHTWLRNFNEISV